MKVLLLGATGTIGLPMLKELVAYGHSVVALARSDTAQDQLQNQGAEVVRGDLREPTAWVNTIREVNAVVHVAATFTEDMGEVDRSLVDAMINEAGKSADRLRFIYTGGCWLYGDTQGKQATEATPLNPIPAFAWMVENARRLQDANCFDLNVVHPAMVYDRDGGVFAEFVEQAESGGPVEVWGALETHWPLVHRNDLARAYRLVLEGGTAGEAYNVVSETGVPVGDIARKIMQRFQISSDPVVRSVDDVVAEQGDWAVGPTLDQHMSADRISKQLGWVPEHLDALTAAGLPE